MDLLPVSSSSVPAVTTDHQVPALSADTRPRTRAGKLVTLYLQPELFLCGVIILIFAPAIKQALTIGLGFKPHEHIIVRTGAS